MNTKKKTTISNTITAIAGTTGKFPSEVKYASKPKIYTVID